MHSIFYVELRSILVPTLTLKNLYSERHHGKRQQDLEVEPASEPQMFLLVPRRSVRLTAVMRIPACHYFNTSISSALIFALDEPLEPLAGYDSTLLDTQIISDKTN
jgi:hypothetical protein